MTMSGTSSLTFSSDKEVYYKVYNISEELLLVTPTATNAIEFLREYLDINIPNLPHIPMGERIFYKNHVYLERISL